MALDPEFIKKIQERKAKREALERKYSGDSPKSGSGGGRSSGSRSSGPRKGPVYRSVSRLSGESTFISGEEARKRAEKAKDHGA